MRTFIFKGYGYQDGVATFAYAFDDGREFQEEIDFAIDGAPYDETLLDRALFLAFMVIGTSYYKTFPTNTVALEKGYLDSWQVDFFDRVYQEGLSQYAFENKLERRDLAHFVPSVGPSPYIPLRYQGDGVLTLQSGGKDSLLTAALLKKHQRSFTSLYISSSEHYPSILDSFGQPTALLKRTIDMPALQRAAAEGARNGHVPVTYIVMSLALVQAILLGKNKILASIGWEGEEPHSFIGDLPVNHQWSKTWQAEQFFAQYVQRYVSANIEIGSPLRPFSELRIAEMFVETAWTDYGHSFSSCNVANYQQGVDNTQLRWCGHCPKCANSYVLFAPFLEANELQGVFGGQDLFTKESLQETFKGLFGVEGYEKPFECVGETTELALAYHMAQERGGYGQLSFGVPSSNYDYKAHHPSQDIAL
jgi:UDP-N-acetyl-alpha-D-muramoyl-L-alanyl-L-glutamate epimerase